MPHEILAEVVKNALEAATDLGSEEIKRRWGWLGCLSAGVALIGAVLLLLWLLGAFDG